MLSVLLRAQVDSVPPSAFRIKFVIGLYFALAYIHLVTEGFPRFQRWEVVDQTSSCQRLPDHKDCHLGQITDHIRGFIGTAIWRHTQDWQNMHLEKAGKSRYLWRMTCNTQRYHWNFNLSTLVRSLNSLKECRLRLCLNTTIIIHAIYQTRVTGP